MTTPNITPDVEEVAGYILARTTTAGGGEAGTFNENTKPTDGQVVELIQDAYNLSYSAIGDASSIPDAGSGDPDQIRDAVRSTIAVKAAALVELTYYPEQIDRRTSPYVELEAMWEESLARVNGMIESSGGETPGGAVGGSMAARYDFPADAGGMVGWGTNW